MKPTPAEPRSRPGAPWLLLAATLALAACGYLLLATDPPPPVATGGRAPAHPGPQDTAAAQPPGDPAARARSPRPDSSPTPSPSKPSASMLPVRGEGRAADRQIQHLLEEAWPADLPPALEQQLRREGAALLRADATGAGRDRFPAVFGNRPDTAVAPAFSRLRIQAAIARKDTRPGRAVVHLVWAAADRGGTYTDNRITDLYFRRTKGDGPWTPLPPP
ncbi:hypothetical protein GCM10010277_86620 [Streptomyces longisporoflavus]|uniref:hypothetical protein n=1 Tax=Streptomyces longisporoflavus TaxID=28044 RepID=UPI00198B5BE9|nr:hypothetical protein [Streptomyces longisporoflavus]GGV73044.1 hypothetical protein GCM10010277_86620 [Streptomyces longisporoflavus]